MGIGAETLLGLAHADLEQKLEHALAGARFVHVAMQLQYLAHLLLDGVQRVERGHRLLEDHGDAVAADRLQLRLGDLQEVAAFKPDLARGVGSRRIGKQLQDRQRGHGLARSQFAYECHRLALADAERDAVDRKHLLAAGGEGNRQVSDVEERVLNCHADASSGTSCADRTRRAPLRPRRSGATA